MNYSCLKCQTAQRTQQGPIEGSSSTVLLRCMITIMKFILSIFLGLESVAKRISGSTIKHSMTIYDLYSMNYHSISFVDCLLAGTCKKYTRHERSCACNMSEGITQGRTLLKGSKRYESPGWMLKHAKAVCLCFLLVLSDAICILDYLSTSTNYDESSSRWLHFCRLARASALLETVTLLHCITLRLSTVISMFVFIITITMIIHHLLHHHHLLLPPPPHHHHFHYHWNTMFFMVVLAKLSPSFSSSMGLNGRSSRWSRGPNRWFNEAPLKGWQSP